MFCFKMDLDIYRLLSKMDLRFEIVMLKLVYTECFMMFGPFGCEQLRFEYFDISKELPEIATAADSREMSRKS